MIRVCFSIAMHYESAMTPTLTAAELKEIRTLIESTGFLPMTNKAERLFAVAETQSPSVELAKLKEMFHQSGYLPRSKALKLLELAGG
jgi:hypothetical protein